MLILLFTFASKLCFIVMFYQINSINKSGSLCGPALLTVSVVTYVMFA